MKKIRSFSLLALSAVILFTLSSFSSCNFEFVKASKNIITQTYDVKAFDKIYNTSVGNVYITQGDNYKLEITGPDNIIEMYTVDVNDKTLKIGHKKFRFSNNKGKVKIRIRVPHLKELTTKGVGDVLIKNGLTENNFKLNSSGVGDVNIKMLNSNAVRIEHKGVGDVEIEGKAKHLSVLSSGVGDTDIEELIANTVDVKKTGVGDLECSVVDDINIRSTGIGDVTCHATKEAKTTVHKKGIGSVHVVRNLELK